MYLGCISEVLSIRNNVSAVYKIQYIHNQLEIGYKSDVKLFIKMIHGISGPTQAHLFVTQINSTRFRFIGIIELIRCLKFLKTDLKFEVLKIGS